MINNFDNEYEFLSNFYPSPFVVDGKEYATVEHAYQSWKVIPEHQETVRLAFSPGEAKRYGRAFPMREDAKSEYERMRGMAQFLLAKFRDNPDLMEKLLATGDEQLVEGNTWGDKFWGVCDGEGQNNLGHLLMAIRENERKSRQKLDSAKA